MRLPRRRYVPTRSSCSGLDSTRLHSKLVRSPTHSGCDVAVVRKFWLGVAARLSSTVHPFIIWTFLFLLSDNQTRTNVQVPEKNPPEVFDTAASVRF